jgi:ketosteroid isomerase-like protein
VPSRHSAAIQRVNAAFNERDLEAWTAEVTEDFEMESRFSSVARTMFRGRDGVIAWWGDLAEVWEWMDLQFQDCADVAADRTVILWTLRGLGRGSGLRLDEAVAQRWYWRGERLAKIEYLDRLEAEGIVRGQQA